MEADQEMSRWMEKYRRACADKYWNPHQDKYEHAPGTWNAASYRASWRQSFGFSFHETSKFFI
jgi:hypothetical protein